MTHHRTAFAAVALAAGMAAPSFAAVDNSDPQRFVSTLTADALGSVRTGSLAAAKTQLRGLLINHVAVDTMGDRLIRRWLNTITPAQRAAYKAALPNYIVGTYADNLLNYRDASVKIVRVQPNAAGADVMTQVIKPGRQPLPAVWTVMKVGNAWKVANLRVGGINVAMAQAADFDSVVQRQGFDALVAMMKSRN